MEYKYIAHKRNETDGKEELLIDHLTETAIMAKKFAEPFDYGDLMYLVGLIHDIGKYSEEFQKRIRGANIQVDHSTAGTQLAKQRLKLIMGAFCIAGHHGGIPNMGVPSSLGRDGTFFGKLKDTGIPDCSDWKSEINDIDKYIVKEKFPKTRYAAYFLIHMLFSCLVDADYICTENFMTDNTVTRGNYDNIETLLSKLNDYVSKWGTPTTKLNILRTEIQNQCVGEKNINEDLLTLTVPTGGARQFLLWLLR